MKRTIARRDDIPMDGPTALEVGNKLLCWACLEANRGAVELGLIRETRTVPEAKIGEAGGVAIVQTRRLFIGYRCPRSGCPNNSKVFEPERVYLEPAPGFLLPNETD
jgi:hypothetical protein